MTPQIHIAKYGGLTYGPPQVGIRAITRSAAASFSLMSRRSCRP